VTAPEGPRHFAIMFELDSRGGLGKRPILDEAARSAVGRAVGTYVGGAATFAKTQVAQSPDHLAARAGHALPGARHPSRRDRGGRLNACAPPAPRCRPPRGGEMISRAVDPVVAHQPEIPIEASRTGDPGRRSQHASRRDPPSSRDLKGIGPPGHSAGRRKAPRRGRPVRPPPRTCCGASRAGTPQTPPPIQPRCVSRPDWR